jgi:Phage integrase, N-terminal SAM-like domain
VINTASSIANNTVDEYLAQWLDHARGRVRARTFQGYEGLIRLYAVPSLRDVPLTDLHPREEKACAKNRETVFKTVAFVRSATLPSAESSPLRPADRVFEELTAVDALHVDA